MLEMEVVIVCGMLLMCLCFDCVFYVNALFFFFLMIRRPPRSTQSRSSAASDVYKRQGLAFLAPLLVEAGLPDAAQSIYSLYHPFCHQLALSLIHISEPTRLLSISYAVFCLKKQKKQTPII